MKKNIFRMLMAMAFGVFSFAEDAGGGGADVAPSVEAQAPAVGGAQGNAETPPAGQSQEQTWYAGLPDDMQEKVKVFENPEDLQAAIERGQNYNPVTDAGSLQFAYPENFQLNPEAEKSYKDFCVEAKLDPKQAQAAIDWQIKTNEAAYKEQVAAGQQQLKSDWGNDFDKNMGIASKAVEMLDRHPSFGGTLKQQIEASGLANDPATQKIMHLIGTAISEESLGGGNPGGSAPAPKSENRYAGFRNK